MSSPPQSHSTRRKGRWPRPSRSTVYLLDYIATTMLYGIILYDCYCAHPTPRQAEKALAAAEAALTHARQLRGEQVYYCATLCYCTTIALLYYLTIRLHYYNTILLLYYCTTTRLRLNYTILTLILYYTMLLLDYPCILLYYFVPLYCYGTAILHYFTALIPRRRSPTRGSCGESRPRAMRLYYYTTVLLCDYYTAHSILLYEYTSMIIYYYGGTILPMLY